MEVITGYFNKKKIINEIKAGKIFIYPTDTIYGLGCDATNTRAIRKIREIKRRSAKPFSVIAPSKEWIVKNCKASMEDIKNLPGPYTYFVDLKNVKAVSSAINPEGNTLGVRDRKSVV